MRKTYILFGLALVLLVGALIVGLPQRLTTPKPPTPVANKVKPPTSPRDALTLGKQVRLVGQLSSGYVLAGQPGQVSLLMDLDAAEVSARARAPMAIALVVDRSGSMAGPKMRQAKRAAKALVARLADSDSLALVTYSSDYAVDVDLTRIKGQRARILRTIDDMLDGGGTNLAGGLNAGLKALSSADRAHLRRVILLSDGNANQGLTDPTAIADIASAARQEGITISTLGIGVDFNEDLMTSIAQAAGGGYSYARDAAAIAVALDKEMQGLLTLAARQVEVSMELSPGVSIEEVYGYRTEKRGSRTVIPVGDMASGAHRQVLVRLQVEAGAAGARPLADVVLAYEQAHNAQDVEHQGALKLAAVTDAAQVAQSQRDVVLEAFTSAEAAKASAEAAATYARGDKAQATDRVRRAAVRLRKANVALKSKKVAAQLDRMEQALEDFESMPASSAQGKDLVKREKLRAYEAFAY